MRILITGASGYIGSILRDVFASDDVTLLSRKTITPRRNEQWFVSGNLQDDDWWSSLPTDSIYDVVFHLAEPVKKNINNNDNQNIIDGHVSFMDLFTKTCTKVIYPLSAYLYDTTLSPSNKIYAKIKQGVYGQLHNNKKISFPIIHPICDSGYGLGKLIRIEKRVPLINTLCAFDSTIPILRLDDLKKIFSNPISLIPGRFDMFSEILPVRRIFKDDTRANIYLISKAFLFVLIFVGSIPSIGILTKGRRIDSGR